MAEPKRSSVPPAGPPRPSRKDEDGRTHQRREPPRHEPFGWLRPSALQAQMVYAMFLAALALPIVSFAGAYMAQKARERRPPAWLMTHYTYQIRTFTVALVVFCAAWVLTFIGVGILMFPLIAVWVVARSVNGLMHLARHDAIADPNTILI